MFVKIKQGESFDGVLPGEIHPTNFLEGAVLEGDLAEVAMDMGVAKEISQKDYEKITGSARLDDDAADFANNLEPARDKPPVLTSKDLGGSPENKESFGSAIDQRMKYLQSEIDRLTNELQASQKQVTITLDTHKTIEDKLVKVYNFYEEILERLGCERSLFVDTSTSMESEAFKQEIIQSVISSFAKSKADKVAAKDLPSLSELTKPENDKPQLDSSGKPKLFGAGVNAQQGKGKDKK